MHPSQSYVCFECKRALGKIWGVAKALPADAQANFKAMRDDPSQCQALVAEYSVKCPKAQTPG
eukprot:3093992-Alexandrium_andersonii.AAC.1